MMDKKEDGELKTLREIEIKIIENTKLWKQNWLQQTSTVIAELRLEAIKWIKYYIKELRNISIRMEEITKLPDKRNKLGCESNIFKRLEIFRKQKENISSKISIIELLFNISEEDLKEVEGKMKLDICELCIHEDFGYCDLRDSVKELKYKNDKNGDLIECSEFRPDCPRIEKMFKKKL